MRNHHISEIFIVVKVHVVFGYGLVYVVDQLIILFLLPGRSVLRSA